MCSINAHSHHHHHQHLCPCCYCTVKWVKTPGRGLGVHSMTWGRWGLVFLCGASMDSATHPLPLPRRRAHTLLRFLVFSPKYQSKAFFFAGLVLGWLVLLELALGRMKWTRGRMKMKRHPCCPHPAPALCHPQPIRVPTPVAGGMRRALGTAPWQRPFPQGKPLTHRKRALEATQMCKAIWSFVWFLILLMFPPTFYHENFQTCRKVKRLYSEHLYPHQQDSSVYIL